MSLLAPDRGLQPPQSATETWYDLQQYIQTALQAVDVFLRLPEAQKPAIDIPHHLIAVQQLLDLLGMVEPGIEAQSWWDMAVACQDRRNELEALEASLGDTASLSLQIKTYEQVTCRQRQEISVDLLFQLHVEGYTDNTIALSFGCSTRTLRRRRAEAGIQKVIRTEISDAQLATMINQIRQRGSHRLGEKMLMAGLNALGVYISRERLRLQLRTMFPEEIARRFAKLINRRAYSVPFYNSLWHIDGHHKLIKWKIVIHGGIDGYSRLITYLGASDNNRADTVQSLFVRATEEHGVPSRVRADYGGENLGVRDFMHVVRGEGRGSFIQGRSTHNQRIERLWVDLQADCTSKYREIFEMLGHTGALDVDNPIQMWCLHFVYLPMINADLAFFQTMWNHHGLRTEHGRSPLQLRARSIRSAHGHRVDLLFGALQSLPQPPDNERIDLSAYGIDNLAGRFEIGPQPEDPMVVVSPVLAGAPEAVGALLGNGDFGRWLRDLIGPPDHQSADAGIGQYLLTHTVVWNHVRELCLVEQ